MDRIQGLDQQQIDDLRAARAAEAQTVDLDLEGRIDEQGFDITDPEQEGGVFADRRSRPCVSYYQAPDGSWKETELKDDDHIELVHSFPAIIIGACSGRDWYCCVSPAVFGDYSPQLMHISYITGRAPADPNETPMPIHPGGYEP